MQSFLKVLILIALTACCHPPPQAPQASVSAQSMTTETKQRILILFRQQSDRSRFFNQKNTAYPLTQSQMKGERLAVLELPANLEIEEFKKWAEKQPGVLVVEKDSDVRMMQTP